MSDSHAGIRCLAVAAEVFVEIFVIPGYGHHRGIVGSEGSFGDESLESALVAEVGDCGAYT